MGVLDGRSPREGAAVGQAASLPHDWRPLLAAILVLEHWAERLPSEIDFNELRTRLGLPALGPIDPPAAAADGRAGGAARAADGLTGFPTTT